MTEEQLLQGRIIQNDLDILRKHRDTIKRMLNDNVSLYLRGASYYTNYPEVALSNDLTNLILTNCKAKYDLDIKQLEDKLNFI